MPEVVVGVAIVEPDISRIGVAEVAYSVRAGAVLGEGRAEVIQRVRISIVPLQGDARAANFARLELHVQRVVMGKASRAAIVDRAELLVRACQTSRRRLTKIDLAHADFVDVRDVVQVNAMRAIIFEREDRFVAQLPLERYAPELRL